jgi:hypothetical protein
MSSEQPPLDAYSADVRLSLEVGDRVYNVGKVGPTRIVVRDPVESGPCAAVLVITVDGNTRRTNVWLPNGAVPLEPVIAFEVLRESATAR